MQDLIGFVESMHKPRVALMGDFSLDVYVYGDCDQVSPEAPVPVLRVVRREHRAGGSAFAAAGVLALGGEVQCLGVVGQDASGQELHRQLMAGGAEVSSLIKLTDRPTTTRTRLIGLAQRRHQQQVLRVDDVVGEPVSGRVSTSLRSAARSAMRRCDVLAVHDENQGVLTDAITPDIISDARSSGVAVVVDPAGIADYSRYRGATLISPNRSQAEQASGVRIGDDATMEHAAERILAASRAEAVVITLDKEGAYLKVAGQPGRRIPTEAQQVYDVSGAGEAVLAALAVAMAGKADLDAAVQLANVVAGLEVERFGAVPIRREELLAELTRQKRQKHGKVVNQAELARELKRLRAAGKAIVMTNGCFDMLHAGHVDSLNFARRQGDVLVVAINGDESVHRVKGPDRPIVGQEDRAEVLAGLECVDYVVVFDDDTPIPLLEKVRPDVLVKGAQYADAGTVGVVGREVVEGYGGKIVLAPMRPGRSATNIIDKIARVYGNHH